MARRATNAYPQGASASAAGATRVRQRILTAFSARARRSGVRSVLMGELASELRMSAMTLYKHFGSKDDLVSAMVESWVDELAKLREFEWDKAKSCNAALEVLLAWADAWATKLSDVSPAFFEDLRRDHPEAWRAYRAELQHQKEYVAGHLVPFLRKDVKASVALVMLDSLVMMASDARFADRFGISRREAVRAALSVWGGGALLQRAKLRIE